MTTFRNVLDKELIEFNQIEKSTMELLIKNNFSLSVVDCLTNGQIIHHFSKSLSETQLFKGGFDLPSIHDIAKTITLNLTHNDTSKSAVEKLCKGFKTKLNTTIGILCFGDIQKNYKTGISQATYSIAVAINNDFKIKSFTQKLSSSLIKTQITTTCFGFLRLCISELCFDKNKTHKQKLFV